MVLGYILLAAICDRRRGRGAVWGRWDELLLKPAARVGLGWAVCMAAGATAVEALVVASVLWLGQLPSFEAVFAWWEERDRLKPERARFYPRFLHRRILAAVAWRGAVLGLPAVPLAGYFPAAAVLPVASALAQVMAAYPLRKHAWYRWGHMEFVRGGLWALIAWVLGGLA